MMEQHQEIAAGSSAAVRRIVVALLVAALMAAIMAASAMPAMAKVSQEKPGQNGGGPPDRSGGLGLANPSSIVEHEFGPSEQTCVKHFGNNFPKETGPGCF
jgi:hypothetical protein